MVVRGPKSVLGYTPSRWKNDKICDGHTRFFWGTSQNGENARIHMIKGNRVDSTKMSQIVLVWNIIAMPSHNIERAAILSALKSVSHKAINNCPFVCSLLVSSDRNGEVSLICKTIGTNWAKVWNLEVPRITLGQPASCQPWLNVYRKEAATRQHNNFFRRYSKFTKLCRHKESTSLRYNQNITVRGVHCNTVACHIFSNRVITDA